MCDCVYPGASGQHSRVTRHTRSSPRVLESSNGYAARPAHLTHIFWGRACSGLRQPSSRVAEHARRGGREVERVGSRDTLLVNIHGSDGIVDAPHVVIGMRLQWPHERTDLAGAGGGHIGNRVGKLLCCGRGGCRLGEALVGVGELLHQLLVGDGGGFELGLERVGQRALHLQRLIHGGRGERGEKVSERGHLGQ